MYVSVNTLCFGIAFLLPSEHTSHRISIPFLLSQHAVKILVIVMACQRLLGFMYGILKSLLVHLALGQPKIQACNTFKLFVHLTTIFAFYNVKNIMLTHPFPHWAYFLSFSAFSPAFFFCSSLSESKSLLLPVLSRKTV